MTNNPDDPDLLVSTIQLHTVNWINTPDLSQPITLWGRYRHQGKLERLTLERLAKDLYQVTFKRSQKAIASGQSLVLYDGQECLGGGVIV
ncbi:MAG: aminomethyltransferase beta-barrel domain-containing protein [Candidatus Doudnabacteria bacterium]